MAKDIDDIMADLKKETSGEATVEEKPKGVTERNEKKAKQPDKVIVGTIPIDELKFRDDNLKDIDEEFVSELAESIQNVGLLMPVVLNSKKEIIDGQHRVRACELAGVKEVTFMVKEKDVTLTQILANYMRRNLTEGQIRDVLEKEKGTQKQIAKRLGLSQGRISQILGKKKTKPVPGTVNNPYVLEEKLPKNVKIRVSKNKTEVSFILDMEMEKDPQKSIVKLFKEIVDFHTLIEEKRNG